MNNYDCFSKIFSKPIYITAVVVVIVIIIPHILAGRNVHVFPSFTAKNQVSLLTSPLVHLPGPKPVKI